MSTEKELNELEEMEVSQGNFSETEGQISDEEAECAAGGLGDPYRFKDPNAKKFDPNSVKKPRPRL